VSGVGARILIGAGAWLLGVAAATGGSLLVVSELGGGIAASPGQEPAASTVSRALAGEVTDGPTPTPSIRLGRAVSLGTRRTSPPSQAPASTAPAPAPPGPQSTSGPAGTVLASPGGTVVAGCGAAGAYLLSWSPQQGFTASSVARGPAATARVVFSSQGRVVTMVVSCSGGVPSAATQVSNSGGGGDE
jgi:hypothetical protein